MTTATTVRPVPIDPVTARKLATTAAKAAQNTVERDKLIAEAYRTVAVPARATCLVSEVRV